MFTSHQRIQNFRLQFNYCATFGNGIVFRTDHRTVNGNALEIRIRRIRNKAQRIFAAERPLAVYALDDLRGKLRQNSVFLCNLIFSPFVCKVFFAAGAVPIFNFTGVFHSCVNRIRLHEVCVVLRVKVAVGFFAKVTNRLILAGCLTAGMAVANHGAVICNRTIYSYRAVIRKRIAAANRKGSAFRNIKCFTFR